MYNLEIWLRQQIREVDEDGTHCKQIVLRSVDNGTPWQTWQIKHPVDIAALQQEIEDVTKGLGANFPVGKCHMVLIALDQDLADFSRFPFSIQGTNRSASNNILQTEGQVAVVQTLNALAETLRNCLGPVNAQFATQTRQIETMNATILAQNQLILGMQERQVLDRQQQEAEAGNQAQLMELAKEYGPALLELLGEAMKTRPPLKVAK